MRKRAGILGTLSVIAMSVALASPATPVLAQLTTTTEEEDAAAALLAKLCAAILETTTLADFNSTPEALAALQDPANPCHALALAQFESLSGVGPQTGALSDGYSFQ